MSCTCDDWIENIEKINGTIMIAFVHGVAYEGKPFIYCPWCANRLMTKEEINGKDTSNH